MDLQTIVSLAKEQKLTKGIVDVSTSDVKSYLDEKRHSKTPFTCLCVIPSSRIALHEATTPVRHIIFVQCKAKYEGFKRPSPWPVVFCNNSDGSVTETPQPFTIAWLQHKPLTGMNKWKAAATAMFHETRFDDASKLETTEESDDDEEGTRGFAQCTLGTFGKQTVETHEDFYATLNNLFRFDHDPCPVFPTEDAMTSTWGQRNYVNPPFRCVGGFILKAMEEADTHGAFTALLGPASTNTMFFFYLLNSEYLRGIVLLYGSIVFKGHGRGMARPLMLLIIGPKRPDTPAFCYTFDAKMCKRKRKFAVADTLLSHFDQLGWPEIKKEPDETQEKMIELKE